MRLFAPGGLGWLFSLNVGSVGCFRVVLRKRGLILNYCGFEYHRIFMESGHKNALFSGRTIYVIAPLQLLTYLILKHFRLAAAEHVQRLEEAYKWALDNAHLPGPLKQPAEQLCLDILSYDGAFQNRRHSPQSIREILHTWLYYLLHNNDRKTQIPNLLASGTGGEATFSVPLHRLHYDIPDAIDGVFDTVDQKMSKQHGEPLPRLGVKLYLNAAKGSGN
jgi:hypothetical protein